MKLENQVCTIEQAKKLLSLCISNDSYFVWGEKDDKTPFCSEGWMFEGNETQFYPAFTVAELGVLLPAKMDDLKLTQWPIPANDNKAYISYGMQYRWKIGDMNYGTFPIHVVFGDTEAKARAELLICLLADKKVTPEECNKRLQK